jgi:capsid protein
MIHGFQPEYAGQGRGFSRLAHAIQEFENLTDFSAAQIKKAINQSSITMYVEPSKDNDASNPFAGISSQYGAGPLGGEDIEAPAAPVSEENGPAVSYEMLPEATIRRPGSVAVFNLREGEKLRPFEGTAPAESFAAFVDAFAGHLAASMSIPLEIVLMKFGQSYSASRAALILFWRVAQIWREELATDFLNPVYAAWLSEEIAAGRISAPGWSDPRLRAAWLNSNWIGVPMPNIDPAKTAAADKAYIEMGAQDLDRVARNLNGSSGARNRAKLSRQIGELTPVPWTKGNEPTGGGTKETVD